MVGIYKITSPSGKVYIGQSWDIRKRFRDYSIRTVKKQRRLFHSFEKYGKQSHKFEVIHELPEDITQLVLNDYEILYMLLYKDCGIKLLNCREGGSNGKMSEASIKLMSEKLKGKPAWNKGLVGIVKMSEETKRLMSESQKRRKHPKHSRPRSKQAIETTRAKNKGKTRTIEQKKRLSDSMKGRPYHGKNNGKVRTQEFKDLHSRIQKARFDNKGELNNRAKLTAKEVLEIRAKYIPHLYSSHKLGREYNLSKTNVLDIVNNRTWSHIN